MKSEVIVVSDIRVENRSGAEILVVEDGNQMQYTTPQPYLVSKFQELSEDQEDRYIGEKWKIAYSMTEQGYKDFEGFLHKDLDGQEPEMELQERVENIDERVANLEQKLAEIKED